jgi:hypothetical protein
MKFDENFLQEMGLSAMPEDQKQKFLENHHLMVLENHR